MLKAPLKGERELGMDGRRRGSRKSVAKAGWWERRKALMRRSIDYCRLGHWFAIRGTRTVRSLCCGINLKTADEEKQDVLYFNVTSFHEQTFHRVTFGSERRERVIEQSWKIECSDSAGGIKIEQNTCHVAFVRWRCCSDVMEMVYRITHGHFKYVYRCIYIMHIRCKSFQESKLLLFHPLKSCMNPADHLISGYSPPSTYSFIW